MGGPGQVRFVGQTQSPFVYAQAMGAAPLALDVNPFSGVGGMLATCLPEFEPSLIQGFQVRLSTGLANTQVPALLSQENTQANIALGVEGVAARLAPQNPQGHKGVDLVLKEIETTLFVNPEHKDLGPVVTLQFVMPKAGKAVLLVSHSATVPKQVVVDTFKKLAEAKKVDTTDIDALGQEIERLKAQVSALEKANEALQTENKGLTALRQRLVDMEREVGVLRAQSVAADIDRDLAGKFLALRKSYQATEAEIGRLREELQAKQVLLEQKDTTIGEQTEEIGRINEELRTVRAEVQSLGEQVGSNEREIQSGVREIERLSGLLEKATKEKEQIRLEQERLERQLELTQASTPEKEGQLKRLAELEGAASAADRKVQELNQAIGDKIADNERLAKENAELRARAEKAEGKIIRLEEEIWDLKNTTIPEIQGKLEFAQSEVEAKRKALAELGSQVEQMRKSISEERDKTVRATREVEKLRKALDETSKAKEDLARRIAAIESGSGSRDEELAGLRSREEANNKKIGELEANLQRVRQELEAATAKRDEFSAKNDRALERIVALEEEIRVFTKETVPGLQAQVKAAEQDSKSKDETIRRAEAEILRLQGQVGKSGESSKGNLEALQRAQKVIGEKVEELRILREEKAKADLEVRRLNLIAREVEGLRSTATSLREARDRILEQKGVTDKQNGELLGRIKQYEAEIKKYREVIVPELERRLEEETQNFVKAQAALNEARREAEEMGRRIQELLAQAQEASRRAGEEAARVTEAHRQEVEALRSQAPQAPLPVNQVPASPEMDYIRKGRPDLAVNPKGELETHVQLESVTFTLTYVNDEGREQKQEFTIPPGESITIGRKGADFIINERSISRKHLIIYNDRGRLKVYDASMFGTSIYGERFKLLAVNGPAELSLNGEVVKIELEGQVSPVSSNPPIAPQKSQPPPPPPQALQQAQRVSDPLANVRPVIKQKLTISDGGSYSREVELAPGEEIIIGRKKDSGIVCNSQLVSGRHAAIRNIGGNLYIVDLQSSNGTVVNGEKIPDNIPFPLVVGDRVQMGDVVFNMGLQPKGIAGSNLTVPVNLETRMQSAKARLQPKETSWAARIQFPPRLGSFSGFLVDTAGKRQIVLVDYTTDTNLTSFLQKIINTYGTIHDTPITQIVRAFLGEINIFSINQRVEEVKSGLGDTTLLGSYSSENIKALLLVLALQSAGIKAVYQGGVIHTKKFIGKDEAERAWVFLPEHNLFVDPVTGSVVEVTNYDAGKNMKLTLEVTTKGKKQDVTYSSSESQNSFFIPTHERLEQNLIDIVYSRGHYTPALKSVLVKQLLTDLSEYDQSLVDRGVGLVEGAIESKLKTLIEILAHIDALTEGFASELKQELIVSLRNIYLGMIQMYNIPQEKLAEIIG